MRRRTERRVRVGRGLAELGVGEILLGGLVVAVVAVVAQTAAQLIDFDIYHLRIGALSSDQHASVFGVASICASGLAAVAAAAGAGTSGTRRSWALASALVAIVMVLRIENVGDGDPQRYVLLLPLVGVILVLLWRLTSREPAAARKVARAGMGLLVLSYVVHVFGSRIVADLGYGTDSWVYQVKDILKHGGELAGWILVATGLAAFARAISEDEDQPRLARRRKLATRTPDGGRR